MLCDHLFLDFINQSVNLYRYHESYFWYRKCCRTFDEKRIYWQDFLTMMMSFSKCMYCLLLIDRNFFINLSIEDAAVFVVFFFYHTSKVAQLVKASSLEIFLQMNLIDIFIIMTSLVCYILTLEWRDVIKVWSSTNVIDTLVEWLLLLIAFVVIQWWQSTRAILVSRILMQRIVLTCCVFIFLWVLLVIFVKKRIDWSISLNSTNFLLIYYFSIYFQAIDDTSAIGSEIRNLSLILTIYKLLLFFNHILIVLASKHWHFLL